ncbi:hypothetical protein OAG94_01390 [bacterium]|nr:hypothetical protein [bacterium]
MKLSNPHWPNCVNLHTFVVDKVLIDKDYLLDWFKKNKKRSVNGVKRKGGKFDKVNVVKWLNNTIGVSDETGEPIENNYHSLLFYLTVVISMIFTSRGQSRWWFQNIHSDKLEGYISNRHGVYTIIKSILETAEILKFNDKYFPGSFTKSVSLHPRFKNNVTTYRSLPNIHCPRIDGSKWIKDRLKPIEDDLALSNIILDNMLKVRLSGEALKIWKQALRLKVLTKIQADVHKRTLQEVYSFAGLGLKESERDRSSAYVRYHEHTGRIYHSLLALPKVYRHCLTYKGAKLTVIDIKSAHAWFLLHWYGRAKAHKTMIDRERKKYMGWFTDRKDRPDFYEKLWNAIEALEDSSKKDDEPYDKDKFKKKFFAFLYGKVREPKDCIITKIFTKEFRILMTTLNWHKQHYYVHLSPSEEVAALYGGSDVSILDSYYRAIDDYLEVELNAENGRITRKNKRLEKQGKSPKRLLDFDDYAYKQVSLENQVMEGHVMVKCVSVELSNDKNNIWHTLFHDAVACQKRRARDVKRVMKKHWKDFIGFNPYTEDTDHSKTRYLVKSKIDHDEATASRLVLIEWMKQRLYEAGL